MNKPSLKKNYIYNVIYQILLILIPIIVTPYISRVLNPEGVGEYSFSSSLITYFTIFASLGFTFYAQREVANVRDDKEKQTIVFWEVNICRLLSVGASIALNVILVLFNAYGNYSILMLLLTINILAIAFDISFFFQGNEEFGKIVYINAFIKLLGTIGIFVFVKNQDDVWIYALLNCMITILSNIAMWIFLKGRLTKIKLSQLKPLKHLKGTFRIFIPTIATSLYSILDKSLIGLILKSDAENGYYEMAEKIVKVAMTVVTCWGTVMIPRNAHEIAHKNYEKVKENIYKVLHFVWLIGIPLMIGIILISDNVVPWFLGDGYDKSATLMKIFSVLVVIIGMSNVLGLQYLLPYKKDKQFTIAITTSALTNLVLNIPLIYFFGTVGAAVATIIAEFIVSSIMLFMARKDLSMKLIFKSAIKPIISSVVMFLAIYPLSIKLQSSILNSFIIAISGVGVYAIMILLLRDKLVFDFLYQIKNKFSKRLKKSSELAIKEDDSNDYKNLDCLNETKVEQTTNDNIKKVDKQNNIKKENNEDIDNNKL